MKTIKKFKSRIALLLSFLMLYTSCSSNEELIFNSKSIIEKHSGEDIFKGIFFSQGEFINEIPSLNRLNVKKEIFQENQFYISSFPEIMKRKGVNVEKEINQRTDSLISKIKLINPEIFQELKKSIMSRNPDVTKSALKKSALVIKTALLQDKEIKKGVSLIKEAYEKGGIDPKNYDLKKESDLKKYNEDVIKYIKSTKEYEKLEENEIAALAIVFFVTVVVLIAWGILAVAAIGGEVAIAYANFVILWNWAFVFDSKKDDKELGKQLEYNLLIVDLIDANESY
jgi:SdpC family antimicrobial peptide